jgi:glycerol-3-phosphate dehydrogenase
LAEKGDINTGASGANHGLLHSGARYVSNDPVTARECREEGELLKGMASFCIEETGGLFVAVEGDDEKYVADFPHLCSQCHIPIRSLDIKDACEIEPALSRKLIAAYEVEDASIDPFKLSLANISQAQDLGSTLLRQTRVVDFEQRNKRIQATRLLNTQTGEEIIIEAKQVINAAGAWARKIAALAGISIHMLYSKGTLLITDNRITERVVNRLRRPSDGDILVPGGTVSILGTTSVPIDSPDHTRPTIEEVDLNVEEGTAILPVLESTRYIRAFAGVRPLLGMESAGDDRSVSRGFALLDHARDGLENFAAITGGKLTSYRLMAERTADLVCRRLGVSSPCLTRTEPLPSTQADKWTEPGSAPKLWLEQDDPENRLLCECEMVPKSVIDSIVESIRDRKGKPSLEAIRLRSRIGKGPCQGTFCGGRMAAYMYDQGELNSDQGLTDLREFLRERWMGERPVLWGDQLIQTELKQALHCGLLGLEL